jgi:hypothetical protein
MNRGNMTRQITEVPMKGSKKGYMGGGSVAGVGMGRAGGMAGQVDPGLAGRARGQAIAAAARQGGMGKPAMGTGFKSGGKVSADMVSPRKAMAMGMKSGAKKGKK